MPVRRDPMMGALGAYLGSTKLPGARLCRAAAVAAAVACACACCNAEPEPEPPDRPPGVGLADWELDLEWDWEWWWEEECDGGDGASGEEDERSGDEWPLLIAESIAILLDVVRAMLAATALFRVAAYAGCVVGGVDLLAPIPSRRSAPKGGKRDGAVPVLGVSRVSRWNDGGMRGATETPSRNSRTWDCW
jgi:hypothetical protein